MTWRFFARGVALVHIAYSFFVLFGALLVLRWPSLLWAHLLAVVWAVATLGFDLGCPLTPWEKALWRRGGTEPYEEGFVQRYVVRTRFSPETARRNHVLLGVGAVAFNIVVYSIIGLLR